MNENTKYNIIKKLVESNGNKKRAAIQINCTVRHINRMIKGYKEKGKDFFIHGNRGRKPIHALDNSTKQTIVDLYRTKYEGTNLTHFSELLEEFEGIKVSSNTIRSILLKEFILSPKAKHTSKKYLQAKLKDIQKSTKSKKQADIIQNSILAVEDAHPRRPRCAYFGEMLQMDASLHPWFGGEKSQLHIAVDDATGAIVGAYFDVQETLNGYYHVLEQILKTYGIPYMFYTDRRTVFEYKQKKSPSIEEDTFTQFGYACKQLGIEIKTSSIPQAKGRVERMFQTLQSRLPIELRLAGINSLDHANEFLNSYIKKFNDQFALPVDNIKSVFETQPDIEKINLILGVLASRKVDNGSCVKYNKVYYLPVDANGHPVYYRKGTCGTVIKAFNGDLYFCVNEKVYALELLPEHVSSSKNFYLANTSKAPKKHYILPMSHPWKQASFEHYCNKQAHRQKENIA
ncbi:ISNCY family transposase [Clostridium tyrobutyricum]|uniref:ISNCY family transposase n=1 Tax=Clostridium tyrobutyricum TaxID=1519 RepID=UPI00073D95B2|nr:ISNCY family transposase [Clostridium tyrobutyricum]